MLKVRLGNKGIATQHYTSHSTLPNGTKVDKRQMKKRHYFQNEE